MDIEYGFIAEAFIKLLPAVPMTLMITGTTIAVGLILAIILIYFQHYNVPVMAKFARFYISFARGTPAMLHIFLAFYGIPEISKWIGSAFGIKISGGAIPLPVIAVIALSFSTSAYFAEIIRSGVLAISKGEIEAAHSIGMSPWQVMRRVILPQAFTLSIPSLGGRCIALLQNSSLAFWIAVVEVTCQANLVAADTYLYLESFVAAGIVYWILTFIIERIVSWLEHRRSAGMQKRGV